MSRALFVFVIAFLFCHQGIAAPATTILTTCTGVHSQFNLATQKTSSILCNLTVLSLPNYVWAGVFINICPVEDWPTYNFDRCLPSENCECSWMSGDDDCSTLCNTTVPGDWTVLGNMEMKVQYWGKYSGDNPFYQRSISNFSIINDASVPCPPGQTYGQNAYCSNCPKGTFSSGETCIPCPLGTVGSAAGQANCTPCAPGYYGGGASACIAAPVGFYSPVAGAFRALACSPGTYAPSIASTVCLICPNGTSSCGAASSCTPCSAGRYSPSGSSICIACPPGTYAPSSGSPSCTPCPPNTYSSSLASSSSSSCVSCPSGTSLLPNCSYSQFCCV